MQLIFYLGLKVAMTDSHHDLENRVKTLVVNKLGIHEAKVTRDALFIDDLGADSLDVMDLVMCLEEELGLEIPDYDAAKLTTVGKAVDYLQQKLS